MGVNFSVDVEGWDPFANGGMKRIFRDTKAFPKVFKETSGPEYEDSVHRPADFALWRKNLKEEFSDAEDNLKMWLDAMDEMETDPDLWFSVSY